jgi:ATP-dependent Clp protease ATP-binding subunit ClpA
MHERFSDRARHAMALANREATRLGHDDIGPEHILLGLLAERDCVANAALKHLQVNLDDIREDLNKRLTAGESTVEIGRRAYNPATRAVIEHAIEEARKLGHKYVGTEHLVLGVLHVDTSVAAAVLIARGVSLDGLREEVLAMLRGVTDETDDTMALKYGEFEWIHQQELAKAFRSTDFWKTMILAVDSANRLGHGEMGMEHLLLGILRNPANEVTRLLAEKGVTADWLRERLTNGQ